VGAAEDRSDRGFGLALIHGAGLGGWIWESSAPMLETPSLLTDFPARDGTAGERRSLTLADYAGYVHRQVSDWTVKRVVLVVHSLGGVVGLKVAAQLGTRLAGFVGVGAAIPSAGGSFVSALPVPKRVMLSTMMRLAGTKPPESAIRNGLCSDLSTAQADEVVDRFAPESRRVYLDRSDAPIPAVPRMYVRLTEDKELPPSLQDSMIANLAADNVTDIASGHLPMIAKPKELARVLDDFVVGLKS
jgi:pimeloyl-ACP methyl ester carboxylesterase